LKKMRHTGGMTHTHHEHEHHHGHHHHAPDFGGKMPDLRFGIGIGLNLAFVAVEIVAGLMGDSLALLADAGHNLGDAAGLILAWGAVYLGRKLPDHRFTYGFKSSSILAALANSVLLLIVTGGLMWEAVIRLRHPVAVAGGAMIAVALAGVLVNGVTAFLFRSGGQDLNIRAVFLHMLSDALISVGVAACGLIICFTGWQWLDSAAGLVVGVVIILASWSTLRQAAQLALHAVPEQIDAREVRAWLAGQAGVTSVHDLHIWAMSTTENALSAHLMMPGGHPGDGFIAALSQEMEKIFGIGHSTIQIEVGDADPCGLEPEHVV
jgi:cobalt-zinc-cadmium efflux system protein